jgi:hypothetical protein
MFNQRRASEGAEPKGDVRARGFSQSEGGGERVAVPEKMRMVSIPERKLASASSCGGLGVVDLEGMGVMDLEKPFSLGSFDSAEREREVSVNPRAI